MSTKPIHTHEEYLTSLGVLLSVEASMNDNSFRRDENYIIYKVDGEERRMTLEEYGKHEKVVGECVGTAYSLKKILGRPRKLNV